MMYYCPASLSFIFQVHPHRNPLRMGSLGVGCTIDKGVAVTVKQSDKLEVVFNEETIDFPTVISTVKILTTISITVTISSPLPLGFGFGISGASALATAFTLNDFLQLHHTPEKLIEIAHVAEVENRTGLGSVATQSTGGFLIKEKPGIPTRAKRLPFIGKKLFATIIGRRETPAVLADKTLLKSVDGAAAQALKQIKTIKSPTLKIILDISYTFAKESGLLIHREVIDIIETIKGNGGHATMAMLGKVVISDISPFNSKYRVEKLTVTTDAIR